MNKLAPILLALALFVSITAPIVQTTFIANEEARREYDPNWRLKIAVFKDIVGNAEIVVKQIVVGGKLVDKQSIYPAGYRRYYVIAEDSPSVEKFIASNSFKLLFKSSIGGKALYQAILTDNQVVVLAKNPRVYRIFPDTLFYKLLLIRERMLREAVSSIEPKQFPGSTPTSVGYIDALDIMNVPSVWERYNITGEGVVVGVVDTGVDFSIPDLGVEAIARDSNGYPLVLGIDYGLFLFIGKAVSVNGTLNTTGLQLPVLIPNIFGEGYYVGIISLDENITVGNITSASGVYRVGMGSILYMVEVGDYTVFYIVTTPAVMVDSEEPSVYDRVYFDLSTTFYQLLTDIREFENMTMNTTTWREPDPSWLDYSVVDEPYFEPGNEVVARDFDGDGVADFSLGTICGYYLDSLGMVNATITSIGNETSIELGNPGYYRGWDYSGGFLALMNDYMGHGTAVASLIAGRGRVVHGGFAASYIMKGVAPSSKLAASSFITIGDALIAEAWMAGYEPVFYTLGNQTFMAMDPYGPHRADIVSNSWGLPYVNFILQSYPGIDYFTLYMDDIVLTRTYMVGDPVTLVFAAGNEGPGYGSVSTPSTGLLVISVGASTSFKFFKAFGFPPGVSDDIIPFSSRGPTGLGYPKPDVLSIGAYEYAGVRTIDGRGYGVYGYIEYGVAGLTLFGGTSEATPLTSGVIALMYQAFHEKYGYRPDSVTVKTILKSSAKDIEYPAYMEGSGRVDAFKAVEIIMEDEWIALIPDGIREAFLENYLNTYGYTAINVSRYLYDTAYYGVSMPGSTKNFTLYIVGNGTAKLSTREFKLYKETTVYEGIYDFNHSLLINIPRYTYTYSDYVEVVVLLKNMSGGLTLTPRDIYHPLLVLLFDWRDLDQDHELDYGMENYFITMDYRIGVETILSITKPEQRIQGTLVAMIQPPIEYLGLINITPQPIKVVVRAYRQVESNILSYPGQVYVNGSKAVNITIKTPINIRPGLREVTLLIETPTKTIAIPVSILVPLVLDNISTTLLIGLRSGYRYDQFVLQAPYDLASGWECKDWRMLPIIITSPEITGVFFTVRWSSGAYSDLEFLVIPPGGVLNRYGLPNYFASYKLAYDTGLVYNPSIRDQFRGKLRAYLPVKWGLPVRYVDLNILDLRYWPPYYGLASTIIPYPNVREVAVYGLYRVMYSFGTYNGKYVEDHVSFRIITVKASARYVEISRSGETSIGYIEYEFKAGAYAPFYGSTIYLITNSTHTYPLNPVPTYIATSIVLNGTLSNLNYSVITAWPGYYVEKTLLGYHVRGAIPVVINITEKPEIDIALVTYRYPWHSEGLYWYDYYSGEVLAVELIYPGVVAVSLTIN